MHYRYPRRLVLRVFKNFISKMVHRSQQLSYFYHSPKNDSPIDKILKQVDTCRRNALGLKPGEPNVNNENPTFTTQFEMDIYKRVELTGAEFAKAMADREKKKDEKMQQLIREKELQNQDHIQDSDDSDIEDERLVAIRKKWGPRASTLPWHLQQKLLHG